MYSCLTEQKHTDKNKKVSSSFSSKIFLGIFFFGPVFISFFFLFWVMYSFSFLWWKWPFLSKVLRDVMKRYQSIHFKKMFSYTLISPLMLLQSLMFNIAIKEIFQMVQTFSDLILLVFFFSAVNVLFFCQNSFTAALRSNKGDISNGQHCLLLVTVCHSCLFGESTGYICGHTSHHFK